MVYSVVPFVYFLLIFCLLVSSIMKQGIKFCNYHFKLFISSFLLIMLHVFWHSLLRCTYICNCCIFLLNWPTYHYKISLPISTNIFIWSLSDGQLSFLAVTVYITHLSHPFTFNIFVSLNLKYVSYRRHISWIFFI